MYQNMHFRRNDQIQFHFDVTFAILIRFARELIIWTRLSELFRFMFSQLRLGQNPKVIRVSVFSRIWSFRRIGSFLSSHAP